MDYRFAKAYMTERLQDAERSRLLSEIRTQRPTLSPLQRIRRLVTENTLSWKRAAATPAVSSGGRVEHDCCPA